MKLAVGDIYTIELPDGQYAFGRVMQDGALQVFNYCSANTDYKSIDFTDIRLVVTLYRNAFKDERMKEVANVAFKSDKDSQPPDTYIRDPIYGKYSIYSEGKITPSSSNECEGLEPTSVWTLDQVIDQLTGKRDWRAIAKQSEEKFSLPAQ